MEKDRTANQILIIDDEISILNLLQYILSRNGYAVETAQNGEEGIRKIENNQYSLILTDMKMPGICGNQVLDFLRNRIKRSTPVIGMSGTPWLIDQQGFDAVINKPCSNKEILELVRQFIEK